MKGSCQTTLTESCLHLRKGEWGAEGMGDKVLREEGAHREDAEKGLS